MQTWTAFRRAFPALVAGAFLVFPVRSEYLPQLQRDLAETNWPTVEEKIVLPRTRLDDVRYNAAGNLAFEGVCLAAGALPADKGLNAHGILTRTILKWFEKHKL